MGEIVFLSLGSNIGNRIKNLDIGVKYLRENLKDITVSRLYETEPRDFLEQPRFLNCVVRGVYSGEPGELLAAIRTIELKMGRQRKVLKGPRTLDIDILFFGNRIVREKNLSIPHPELLKRQFVLIPLLELEPQIKYPEEDKYVWKYHLALGSQGVYYYSFFITDEIFGKRNFGKR